MLTAGHEERAMEELELRLELHRDVERQGTRGDDEPRLAITLSGLAARQQLAVADIGCGTGTSTLALARELLPAAAGALCLVPYAV